VISGELDYRLTENGACQTSGVTQRIIARVSPMYTTLDDEVAASAAVMGRGGFRHVQHVRPNSGPHKKGPPQEDLLLP